MNKKQKHWRMKALDRIMEHAIVAACLSVCCICLLSSVLPHTAEAATSTLIPDSQGVIFIGMPILVDTGNTLSIPAGATVEFAGTGSIFVRGRLNIGVDGYHGSSSEGVADLIRGTKMSYSGSMPPITVRGGMLAAFNVQFEGEKFINAFLGASIVISSSTFQTDMPSSIISVYQNSTLLMDSSAIRSRYPGASGEQSLAMGYSGSALLDIYSNSHATMTAMSFESPMHASAVIAFNQSSLRIDDSRFELCHTGITTYGTSLVKGTGNAFSCKLRPHYAYGGATIELLEKAKECCSRVIFVPGIKGSRLYRKENSIWFGGMSLENQLWEPDSASDVKKLFLDASGVSILPGIYVRDVIDRINILGKHKGGILSAMSPSIYGNFIAYLQKLKEDKAIDGFIAFAYDWRLGLQGLRDNGLVAEIRKQAALASDEKVILIAHSFGGFVVKDALAALSAEGKKGLVRSVIYVAFPETGAPYSIFSAIHGDEQSILGGVVMDSASAIRLAANMPSAHIAAPAAYFAKPIVMEFLNKRTRAISAYASSTLGANRYSLANAHAWLMGRIRSADAEAGMMQDSPAAKSLSVGPSAAVSAASDIMKESLYGHSLVLESEFRTYSIMGIGMPTPIGMLYEYVPCIPPINKMFGIVSPCMKESTLGRIAKYSKYGDGVVIFDGKDRRSGTDFVISIAESNARNKASVNHSTMMESVDVQKLVTAMIRATSSPQTDPFSDGASGTGFDPINPWINTGTVFGLDISGFVEGEVRSPISVSATSSSIAALQIVTLDQAQRVQRIGAVRDSPDALAAISAMHSGAGWSFGSPGPFESVSLKSMADQSISLTFSEHAEASVSRDAVDSFEGTGEIATTITESFSGIDAGFGSIISVSMQYVTPVPSHEVVLDVDADGIGDIVIPPDEIAWHGPGGSGSGSATSSGSNSLSTYAERRTIALEAIADARIAVSRLEVYALRQSNTAMLRLAERYVLAGNPSFALIVIKKRQARLAEISAQYATRLERLQKGLLERVLRQFRLPSERLKREAEIAKIQAYVRDLARLKIILKRAEEKAIDLLL